MKVYLDGDFKLYSIEVDRGRIRLFCNGCMIAMDLKELGSSKVWAELAAYIDQAQQEADKGKRGNPRGGKE